MQTKSETRNPFLNYFEPKLSSEAENNVGDGFDLAQAKSLYQRPDKVLSQIFLLDNLYSTKTFANGTQYDSFCLHGPLGSYPFDGVLERIVEGKDDFQKALVLTTNYENAKLQARRLGHRAFTACEKTNPQASSLVDRIRTATSIEKDSEAYRDYGVDTNDEQILFYDISQTRNNLGTSISKLRKDLPDPAEFNKAKKEFIQKEVKSFIDRQNLTNTNQLYIDSAEEFKTDLGYDFLQELVKQLKISNGGGDLKIGAVANFNYSHGESSSLGDVFGKLHYLKTPAEYQRDARIPKTMITRARSLTERETTSSADIAKVTKTSAFNNALRARIQERLVKGDKRVFVRAHSNIALEALKGSFDRNNDSVTSSLSYGWIAEGKAGYVDSRGIEHEVRTPQELLSSWGNGFNTLIHSGFFDKLQEPADTVVTATKIKTPDRLEELASPLGTFRDDQKEQNHLIYYQFGKIKLEDAGQDQNPKHLLEQINRRHNSRGSIQREIKSGSYSSTGVVNAAPLSDVTEDEAAMEQDWQQFPDSVRHFWTNIFGSQRKLMSFIANYIREKDSDNKVIGDSALFSNEMQFVWKLVNLHSQLASTPSLEHDKREVFESLFRQANKSINDYVSTYPSILGIENLNEAKSRVRSIFKNLNNEINKSKDPVLSEMDSLFKNGNYSYENRITHRSSLMAEFLFTAGEIDILKDQPIDPNTGRFLDTPLSSAIQALVGIADAQGDDQAQLVQDFKAFVSRKKFDKLKLDSETRLGISLRNAEAIADEYILDEESVYLEDNKEAEFDIRKKELVDSLMDAKALDDSNTHKFYKYVCEHPKGPSRADVLRINSDLLVIDNFDEAAVIISSLDLGKPTNGSQAVSNWKRSFASLERGNSLLAWYILEKEPELYAVANREQLTERVRALSGHQVSLDEAGQADFREFIEFLYEKSPETLSKLVSSRENLRKEQVLGAVVRANPNLTGLKSKAEMEMVFRRSLKVEAEKLAKTRFNTNKISNLSSEDYQALVVELAAQIDFDKFVANHGVSVEEVQKVFCPDGLESKYNSGYEKILSEARTDGHTDVADLQMNWEVTWSDPAMVESLVKPMVLEELLRRRDKPDDIFALNAVIADNERKGYFLFSDKQLVYAEFIKPVPGSKKSFISSDKNLNVRKHFDYDMNTAELVVHDYLDIWDESLGLTSERIYDRGVAYFENERQMLVKDRETVLADLDFRREDSLLNALLRPSSGRREAILTNDEVRKAVNATSESLQKSLSSVFGRNVSRRDILEMFYEYLNSDYIKNHNLMNSMDVIDSVSQFLVILAGGGFQKDDPTKASVPEIVLSSFIDYIASTVDDDRAATTIIKSLAQDQDHYFNIIKVARDLLEATGKEGLNGSLSAFALIHEATGADLPQYKKIYIESIMKIMENRESSKDKANLLMQLSESWAKVASQIFLANVLDIKLEPRLPLSDGDKEYVLKIHNAREANYDISFEAA